MIRFVLEKYMLGVVHLLVIFQVLTNNVLIYSRLRYRSRPNLAELLLKAAPELACRSHLLLRKASRGIARSSKSPSGTPLTT